MMFVNYEIILPGPEEKPVALLSTQHILSKEKSISLVQLENQVILSLGKYNPSAHKCILDLCNIAGFSQKKILECDYFFRLKRQVDNKGVAITTDLGVNFIYIDSKRVRPAPISFPLITRTQSIAWRKDHFLLREALIFLQALKDASKSGRDLFVWLQQLVTNHLIVCSV
jgi:hypothetical protein